MSRRTKYLTIAHALMFLGGLVFGIGLQGDSGWAWLVTVAGACMFVFGLDIARDKTL